MTRTDFIEGLDRLNIIAIDSDFMVSAASRLALRVRCFECDCPPLTSLQAAQEIVNQEGFQTTLDNVLDRITDVEWLGRTRRLVKPPIEDKGEENQEDAVLVVESVTSDSKTADKGKATDDWPI